jgi:hypothetical protein
MTRPQEINEFTLMTAADFAIWTRKSPDWVKRHWRNIPGARKEGSKLLIHAKTYIDERFAK